MIGIYKITNNINGKIYIGQSNNIQRRFSEHRNKGRTSRIVLDWAIAKYGPDNFSFDILEECLVNELNEKETYWIKFYNAVNEGYNVSYGGNQQSVGENNGRAQLTSKEVEDIRKAYQDRRRRRDIYESYKHKVSFSSFAKVWDGSAWPHIMPEVYTKESKEFYSRQATNGELSPGAAFTNLEVIQLRERYVHETAKEIYQDNKHRCSFQTLQQILWGRSYSDLPIYKKKQKEWINK